MILVIILCKYMSNISEILQFLEEEGWLELIDSRWKDDVIRDIKLKFPNISEETINEVLKVTLW